MKAWQKRATQALEWNRFLALAEQEAKSHPAKALIRRLEEPGEWAKDVATSNLRQKETQEALLLLSRQALWSPLEDLADPSESLERLSKDAVLEVTELAFLRRWLNATDSWVQLPREEVPGDLFKGALQSLPDPRGPLKILGRVLTPEGELSERATPRLATLYSEIRALKREISSVLDHLVKTFSQKGVLQENFTDVRDGRYVLPVKISSQGEVEGIIYEASASRQTVFVEPKEVSPLNNRLRQRQNDLLQEIFAVLSETSGLLRPFASEIAVASGILSHWDAVRARASLGVHYSGQSIRVTDERQFRLPDTAHPMLWQSLAPGAIVRNTIDFGDSVRTFLITGPNTGGKTVLLKTLGMAGLCARTGFPFPGSGQPHVPFFDSFFADLGDPQSIEEHLSSFSGHVLRFKEILEEVSDRSLVLIDELNTATDPEEGAALGRAFLETVMSRGAMIVTTTHDPHLKGMAASDPRILNASMAFDEEARSPTFLLAPGVPGRSRALETAERLGIPAQVLALARSYLSEGHTLFENMLGTLEKDSHEAARARKEAAHLRDEAARLKKEWTERTEQSVGEALDRTRQKLRRIVEQAQEEVRASVRKLEEMRSHRELDVARTHLNEALSEASQKVDSALNEEAPEIARALEERRSAKAPVEATESQPRLEIGASVRVPKWKAIGTILDIKGTRVNIAMGNLKVSVSVDEIEPLQGAELAQAEQIRRAEARKRERDGTPAAPGPSIDIRGERLEDAMGRLERYLDLAFRSHAYSEVTVVHGLGTGALREGARKLLKNLPYVKSFRDGGAGAGGTGATLVEFER